MSAFKEDLLAGKTSPGPIAGTEGMSRLAPGLAADGGEQPRIPLKRWGTVEEVAECAVFLCSPSTSYVTGTVLDCDGGSQLRDASRAMPQRTAQTA